MLETYMMSSVSMDGAKYPKIKKSIHGVPWWFGTLRIWHCHHCGSGHYSGLGLISGPGNSTWHGHSQKNVRLAAFIHSILKFCFSKQYFVFTQFWAKKYSFIKALIFIRYVWLTYSFVIWSVKIEISNTKIFFCIFQFYAPKNNLYSDFYKHPFILIFYLFCLDYVSFVFTSHKWNHRVCNCIQLVSFTH